MRQKVTPLALEPGLFVLRKPQAKQWALALLAASCLPVGSQNVGVVPATQLPQGGKVLGGAASITQSTGNLQINQTTPRAVLEWNSFNLGSKAQVNFVQPSSSSVALNRVLDTQASQILGRINANGQVFISNPNGVLFGPTAQVDVGGLLVTTHGISTEDFMSGKSSFQGTGPAAVVNQGELRAALGGYIALLAPQVRNEGVIVAKEGSVALAAGEKITLQFAGQSLTAVQVDRAVVDALVDNQHLVRAEGGWVVMTARSANALLQSVVKNSGMVQAPSLVSRQGRIILEGGSVGRVEVTGELSATGGKGLAGGSVWVTGDQVTLGNTARIDVSGDTAGGQVLVGGGWPDSVGPLAKSSEVNLGEGVSIKASANGIGNGGYIETSAKKVQIAATAKVDTSAPNGKSGQWVIDPVDIDINSSLASAIATALNSGDVLVSTDGGNTPSTASGETSGVGNISVNSPISWSANRLTLKAANNLYVNQVLQGSGTASLRFHMTSADGIDRVYIKAPIYLPEGNSLSAVDGPAGDINFRVITRLGSAGSTTGTDLQGISGNLNGYYALGADIDASATSLWNGGAGFAPIGNSVTPFAGALTGLGHVISNLTINRPTTDSVGLFGRSVGVLSELGLVNASIVGANQVGTLVGNNAGYTTTNFVTGSVTGQSSVGGLMGVLDGYGTARNSYAKTNVSVTGNADAGGLIGLVNVGTVYKTYSTGTVTNLGGGAPSGVGGLIGRLGTGVHAPVDVSTPGFWDTTLSGQSGSAAGVGLDTASTMRWSSLAQFNLNTNDFWLNYYGKSTPLLKAFLTPLTITASNANKTYDGLVYSGSQAFSTSISTNSYLLGADTMQYGGSGATAVNVGTYSIVPSGLYSNDNRGYAISYANGTLSIQKADLTLSGTRPYDGSTVMAGTYLTANGVNGETFTVVGAGATGNLSTRNAQTAQPLATSAGLALGSSDNGGLSSNYNALGVAGSSVTVTPKSVTLTAPTASKVYDGTSSYVATSDDLSALSAQLGVVGDGISSSTLSFANKNAGLGNKALSLSAATVNDGNSGLNYAISYAGNNNSTITPKALTISGITAADKVYDGTATAAVSTAGVSASVLQAGGMVAGDDVQVSASGNFRNAGNTANDKNVGNAKTVQLSSSYSGTDVDNYSITGQASTTASITPKALTISGITAADKVYDGTSTAAVSTAGVTASVLQANGMVAGDDVQVSASGNFRNAGNTANDKNVGNAKTVQLSSSYSGTDVDNYSITGQASTTASITPKALTISGITAADKVYDGTSTAAVSTAGVTASVLQTNGMVAGDDVQVSASGNFRNAGNTANDKNVGNAKTVQLSSSYSGTDVGNYSITGQASTTASITPKALTISGITAADKVYDGTATAVLNTSLLQGNGLLAGDDVWVSASGNFRNAGNTANDKNVGNAKTVLLSSSYSGTDVGNYSITGQASTTASITPKALTISGITAADKVYDGTATAAVSTAGVTASVLQANGMVAGDDVQVSASGNFRNAANTANDKNVGNAKTVQLSSSYSGTDVDNYSITGQASTTASITPKALTISGITAADKVYDGTSTAAVSTAGVTASVLQANGMVAGDDVQVSASGNFRNAGNTANDKNVGNAKTVQLSSSYSGTDVDNYSITGQASTTASITPKALTISGITAADKVYDGTSTAAVSTAGVTASVLQTNGMVAGDDVQVSASGNFRNAANTANDKNVGNAKTVQLSSSYSGTDVDNYSITGQASTTASITPKALTISGITAADKVYDGTSTAAVSTAGVTASVLQANGMVAGDDVQVSASGNFRNAGNTANDKNVGNAKTVQLSSSYSGTDVDNYSITGQASTTASITPKALTISGITAADKVYDGTSTAAVSTAGVTASVLQTNGMVAGDDVQVSASGNFRNAGNTANDKNVGNAKTVQLSSSYSGTDVDNYSITGQASTTASITPKALTISGITAADKVYDGTSTAAVSTAGVTASVLQANGMVAGDDVRVSASGNFRNAGNTANDKNVGNAKTVQLSSSYSGTDVGNYRITGQATTTASVTARPLDVTGLVPNDKTYDGSTDATLTGTAQISVFSNDDVSLQIGTAQFDNPAVGNLIPIATQGFKLNGADAKNYQLNQPAGMRASITAIDLSLVRLNLSAQSMALLTKQQMAGLTPEQVSYLTDVQFGALSQAQLTSLSPQVWSKVSVANIANLPPEKIAVIGAEAWRNWSVNQIQSLTPTQIQSMTPAQIAGWEPTQLQALSERQVASLGGALLQALNGNQWQALSLAQIKTLSPNQLTVLSTTQLASWTPAMVAGLSSDQVASLNVGQVKSLSKEQFNAMTSTQWQALSQAQIASIPPEQIATLKPSTLAKWSSPQIAALDAAQMRSLNGDHLAALSQPQMMQLAATGQLQVIVSSDIAKVQVTAGLPAIGTQTAPPSSFGESAPSLNAEPVIGSNAAVSGAPARLNAMPSAYKSRSVAETQPLMVVTSSRQITQFDGTQVAALKPAQIKLMNGPQIDALLQSHGRELQPAQWAHFSATQISTISPAVWATLGREIIQGLGPQQLAELTPSQFASMTNNQLQWLSPFQIGALQRRSLADLSPDQFKALVSQRLQALEPQQIQTATPSQWVSLSPNQMRSLTLHQMPALGAALLSAMTPEHWAMMLPDQIKLITPQSLASVDVRQLAPVLKHLLPDQLSALDPLTLAALESRYLTALSPAQWGALLPKQFAALSESQLNALQPNQVRSLADDALNLLAPETVSRLAPAVLAAMTPAHWHNLTAAQIQALQGRQLATLEPTQFDPLGARVLQALSGPQLTGLTVPQQQALQALKDKSRALLQLTPAQIGSLNASDIPDWGVAPIGTLNPNQMGALQARHLQALTLPQWKAISPSQFKSIQPPQWSGVGGAVLKNLSPTQLAAINPEQARVLQPAALSALAPSQLQAMSPQALGAMTPEQWGALSVEQLAALSPRRLAGLPSDFLGKLQPRQIQAFTPDQISGLNPSQMAAMPQAQVASLTPGQFGSLHPQALAQMSPSQFGGLMPAHIASLQPHQMAALTGVQIKGLQAPQLQALQAGQIAAFQPAQLNALMPSQIRVLMPQQLYQIAPVQMIALSPSVIQWLSPAQWQVLRPEVMAVLQPEQIQALRPALIAALTPGQLSALKSSQVKELAKEQVAALGAGQLWSLSNAQLHALTPSQVSAVRSVPLGSLLPLLRAEQIQGLDKVTLAMINPVQLRQLNDAQARALTLPMANAEARLLPTPVTQLPP